MTTGGECTAAAEGATAGSAPGVGRPAGVSPGWTRAPSTEWADRESWGGLSVPVGFPRSVGLIRVTFDFECNWRFSPCGVTLYWTWVPQHHQSPQTISSNPCRMIDTGEERSYEGHNYATESPVLGSMSISKMINELILPDNLVYFWSVMIHVYWIFFCIWCLAFNITSTPKQTESRMSDYSGLF